MRILPLARAFFTSARMMPPRSRVHDLEAHLRDLGMLQKNLHYTKKQTDVLQKRIHRYGESVQGELENNSSIVGSIEEQRKDIESELQKLQSTVNAALGILSR